MCQNFSDCGVGTTRLVTELTSVFYVIYVQDWRDVMFRIFHHLVCGWALADYFTCWLRVKRLQNDEPKSVKTIQSKWQQHSEEKKLKNRLFVIMQHLRLQNRDSKTRRQNWSIGGLGKSLTNQLEGESAAWLQQTGIVYEFIVLMWQVYRFLDLETGRDTRIVKQEAKQDPSNRISRTYTHRLQSIN